MMPRRRLRGHNHVFLSGYVDGRLVSGTTHEGEPAFSFSLAVVDSGGKLARIRVNGYDRVAESCNDMASQGVFCSVVGEIMNRPGKYSKLVEIRAKEVEFFPEVDNISGDTADLE